MNAGMYKKYKYIGADSELITSSLSASINKKRFWNAPKSCVSLGTGHLGAPIYLDLHQAPHVLIGGTTGSGKSVLLNDMIISLVLHNSPKTAKLILIDPKIVEFMPYSGLPHLYKPVIAETSEAIKTLKDIEHELDERCRDMANRRLREYDGCSLYVFVDELADLVITGKKPVEERLLKIAQKGRAARIHLILATQQPSVKIMPSALKANCPTRIALKVKTISDSRIILDHKGAENLRGKGDAILSNADGSEIRFQAGYISPDEIDSIVADCRMDPIRVPFKEQLKMIMHF